MLLQFLNGTQFLKRELLEHHFGVAKVGQLTDKEVKCIAHNGHPYFTQTLLDCTRVLFIHPGNLLLHPET